MNRVMGSEVKISNRKEIGTTSRCLNSGLSCLIIFMNIEQLKYHPFSKNIYGDEELPEGFIESIDNHGILVPLVVKKDGTIISGHRRWRAAKALKIRTVPVKIVDYDNELEEREAIKMCIRDSKMTTPITKCISCASLTPTTPKEG